MRTYLTAMTSLLLACSSPSESSDTAPDAGAPSDAADAIEADGSPPLTQDAPTCSEPSPLADIVAVVAKSPTGDIERAEDGTFYFVTLTTNVASTIGRRVPCGAIEASWLALDSKVIDIAVTSHDELYVASVRAANGAQAAGVLSRVDLAAASPMPTVVRTAAAIVSLRAVPAGDVYFAEGRQIGVVTNGTAAVVAAFSNDELDTIESIAPLSTGAIMAAGTRNGLFGLGRFSQGAYAVRNDTRNVNNLHADDSGGFYADWDDYVLWSSTTFGLRRTLTHAAEAFGPLTDVAHVDASASRFVFGASDATVVLAVATDPTRTTTSIPVPVPTW